MELLVEKVDNFFPKEKKTYFINHCTFVLYTVENKDISSALYLHVFE